MALEVKKKAMEQLLAANKDDPEIKKKAMREKAIRKEKRLEKAF